MKSVTFEVTERDTVWYRDTITVTEEDVRRYLLQHIEATRADTHLNEKQRATIVTYYLHELEKFAESDSADTWEEVALELFKRPATPLETNFENADTEFLESSGWDDDGEEDAEDDT